MAGILDVFTFVFKADTDQVSEGTLSATENAKKLDKEIQSATKSMDDLGNKTQQAATETMNLASFVKQAAGFIGGFVAVSEVFSSFKEAVNAADHLDEFSESIEGNVEDLDIWGNAVKMNGGDMEGFKMSIGSLAKAQADLAAKGRSRLTPFFEELGIKLTEANGKAKTALELLPEIADSFAKLPKAQSLAFGERLGLDAGTVRLLQSGRVEIDKLLDRQRKLGVITAQQAKISAEYNDALDDTAHVFRTLYLSVAEYVLPVLTSMLEGVQNVVLFLRENAGFAAGFFSVIGAAITASFIPAIAAAAVATWAFLAPWLATIAGITAFGAALGVALNDIEVWKEGGKSAIGELGVSWDNYETMVIDVMEMVGNTISTVTDLIKVFWDALLHPMDTLSKLRDALIGALSPLADMLPSIDSVLSAGRSALSSVSTPLSGLTSAAMGAAAIASNTNTVTVGKVEVHTQAQDAEGISRSIDGALKRQLLQTTQTFDDSVAY